MSKNSLKSLKNDMNLRSNIKKNTQWKQKKVILLCFYPGFPSAEYTGLLENKLFTLRCLGSGSLEETRSGEPCARKK